MHIFASDPAGTNRLLILKLLTRNVKDVNTCFLKFPHWGAGFCSWIIVNRYRS